MKTNSMLYITVIALLFASCENEIPFEKKESSPKLAVNAMIDINSENNYIFLSKTGKNDVDSINNATINIYINGVLKEQLTTPQPPEIDFNSYDYMNKKYQTDLRFNPGDKVKIEVFADNNKYHAWAEDIIPNPLEIENIDTMTYLNKKGTYSMRLKTTFTDFPNEKNFYRLVLVQKRSFLSKSVEEGVENLYIDEYEDAIPMETQQDIVLNDGRVLTDDDIIPKIENNYTIFDDTRLNTTYTMTTSIYSRSSISFYDYDHWFFHGLFERASLEYKVHLISISEMQYYYLKALNVITSSSYNEYISMPVVYPSNVKGGVGLVGFSAGTYKSITLPDFIPYTGYGGGYYPK